MIALIDGDILVYRIGFAANNAPWPICRSRVDEFLENLLVFQLDVDDYEGWLTEGSNNFRNKIAVTVPYKGTRPGIKPVHYDQLRSYLVSNWGFTIETEQEADDAIGIRATELGEKALICSIDKDLDNIPGWHYNFVTKRKYHVDDATATRNFYRQILTGDRIDNVEGIRGVGPIKADRILDGDSEAVSSVHLHAATRFFRQACRAFDGDYARVVENGKLLWIRRQPGEVWTPPCTAEEILNENRKRESERQKALQAGEGKAAGSVRPTRRRRKGNE